MMNHVWQLVGRVLLAPLFLYLAASLLMNWDGLIESLGNAGWMEPSILVFIGFILAGLGGAALLLGKGMRLGAVLLLIFGVIYFWLVPIESKILVGGNWQALLGELAILGGLFFALASGGKKKWAAAHEVPLSKEQGD